MQKNNAQTWYALIGIMLFSLIIGYTVWKINPCYFEPKEDSRQYHDLAKNFVQHKVLSLDTNAPFRPSARRTPGYPLFLALLYSFVGVDVSLIKFVQILLGPLTCLFVYLIGQQIFENSWQSLIVSFFLSFTPAFVLANNRLMSEGLFTLILIACLYICFIWRKEEKIKWAITAGIMLGLLGLIKPEASLLCIPLLFSLLITSNSKRTMLFQSIISLIFVVLLIGPWVYRNYKVYGKPCLISGQGEGQGRGMMTAYRIRVEQGFMFAPDRFKYLYGKNWKKDYRKFKIAMKSDVKNPNETNFVFYAKRPFIFLQLCMIKGVGLLRPTAWSRTYGITDDFTTCMKNKKYFELVFKGGLLIWDFLIVVVGLTGFLLSLLWENKNLWIISSSVFYFISVYVILHGIPRYRVPIVPLFLLLGVWFICKSFYNSHGKT